jgi:hypothetical protein
MSAQAAPALRSREELLRARGIRRAWIYIAIGLLVPIVALLGSYTGWTVRQADGGGQLALILAGVTVFVVRLGLYVL